MQRIRARRGLLAKVARELRLTRSAVAMWERVPAERLPEVERITGIPRHLLRDDICPPPGAEHYSKESAQAAQPEAKAA